MNKIITYIIIIILTVSVFTGCTGKVTNETGETGLETSKHPESNGTADTVTDTEAVVINKGKKISFIAGGDVIVHDAVREDAKARASADNPNYNFFDMFGGIAPLVGKADISYVNMEGCVGGASLGYLGYPDFNAPEEIGETFVKLGFDIINLANNHMLDYDEKGLANTIAFFKKLPVTAIGGYAKSDYDNIRVYETQGVTIAFLSYTTLINYAHVNSLDSSSSYLVPYAVEADIRRQVALARERADFVFVSMHWGTEDDTAPDSKQKNLAKLCADLGVDVIVGTHSHTLQPVEWVEGKDGNKTLVAYSLGNLISTMYPSKNMVGGLLSLDIAVSAQGEKSIENVKLIPTVCHYSLKRDSLAIYQLSEYTDELAKKHGTTLRPESNYTFSVSIAKKFVTDIISSEFLPDYLKVTSKNYQHSS